MNTPSNPYAPPKAFVQDVVDENAAAELAGRGTRLGAYLLDSLIGGLILVPLMFSGLYDFESLQFTPGNVSMAMWLFSGAVVLGLTVLTFYWLHKYGQTIAKRIVGIKIVRKDGSRAGLGRIFWLRYIVAALPGVILGGLWTIIDALFIFGEPRQCVHDKIADTIVVKA
jgi:uncharacterized RDD family membrane protein YckC